MAPATAIRGDTDPATSPHLPPITIHCHNVHIATISTLPHVHIAKCAHCHSSTLPYNYISTLPHVYIDTCPHCHMSPLPHVPIATCPHVYIAPCPHCHMSTLPHVYIPTCPHSHMSTLLHVHMYIFPHVHIAIMATAPATAIRGDTDPATSPHLPPITIHQTGNLIHPTTQ